MLQTIPDSANGVDRMPRIREMHKQAKARRDQWLGLWQDCYQYALPQRDNFSGASAGQGRTERVYDGTAMDAVDQLASSLMGKLTPPWSGWFGFKPGPDLPEEDARKIAPVLENAARIIQEHFDRSNFAVEMHQCYLDLVTGGTAVLLFEEATPGQMSAFRFQAMPLNSVVLEEGEASSQLQKVFRTSQMNLDAIKARFPDAELPAKLTANSGKDKSDAKLAVSEAVIPTEQGYQYVVYLEASPDSEETVLYSSNLSYSPYISFRWSKSPGEVYGRSPVMKALPDIRTANKVVELILKNASLSVSGIWQADDDGVLNLADIDLTPGTIIPKAVGSKGLSPLEMPSRFDVSQLVLDDLRSRIRNAMMVDKLGQINQRNMTATEVLERASEMALLMGATYGRLQSELLMPLIQRAYSMLRRRGEIPDIDLDGRLVQLDIRSPLAKANGQKNAQNILNWLSAITALGPEASAAIDVAAVTKTLGEAMGVPSDLIRKETAQETFEVLLNDLGEGGV